MVHPSSCAKPHFYIHRYAEEDKTGIVSYFLIDEKLFSVVGTSHDFHDYAVWKHFD